MCLDMCGKFFWHGARCSHFFENTLSDTPFATNDGNDYRLSLPDHIRLELHFSDNHLQHMKNAEDHSSIINTPRIGLVLAGAAQEPTMQLQKAQRT